MRFRRVRRYPGGALGEMSRAVNSLQQSMERIRAGYGITLLQENNSIAICALDPSMSDGGLNVAGTPALFKSVQLVGWSKSSSTAAWAQMTISAMVATPPTRLWTEFVDGVDSYPWYALRPTWDYVRAYEEP